MTLTTEYLAFQVPTDECTSKYTVLLAGSSHACRRTSQCLLSVVHAGMMREPHASPARGLSTPHETVNSAALAAESSNKKYEVFFSDTPLVAVCNTTSGTLSCSVLPGESGVSGASDETLGVMVYGAVAPWRPTKNEPVAPL